jgi:F-type H+-transporting ATPase subunit delta
MANTTHQSPTAVTYARALLELAQAQGKHQEIGQELADLYEILLGDPTLQDFLGNPAIGHEERTRLLDKAFKPQVDPLLANFLGVMNLHGRLGLLGQVAQAYSDLLDDLLGKIEVDVTVSQRLTDDELEQVRQKVGAALKRDAVVHQYVDESIIGGMVLRVGDQLIDASVKSQLDTMKRQLLAARPK